MLKLAKVFQDGMILQRNKTINIWGESDADATVVVTLNGVKLGEYEIKKGRFLIKLPPQEASFSATLAIGDIVLSDLDLGEVFIAGGQSNMEFYIKLDAECERVYALPEDRHFRYFEVAKYPFVGAENDNIEDTTYWDKWFYFNSYNCKYFSAVATYCALELRQTLDVPIGIVSCCVGGTTAATWLDEALLAQDPDLRVYCDEYAASVSSLDLDKYYFYNDIKRRNSVSSQAVEIQDTLMKNTPSMQELFKLLGSGLADNTNGIDMKEMMQYYGVLGPNSENRPGALYKSMLSTVAGFTARGVIWYQGCSDDVKHDIYSKLLTALINCWRRDWADQLPFIVVQLAPFGSWMQSNGTLYPDIRAAQQKVSRSVDGVYLVSSSDVGNNLDIHPKYKRPIGHRVCLMVLNRLYGKTVVADAPSFKSCTISSQQAVITFDNAEGLHCDGTVNALEIFRDGVSVPFSSVVKDNKLVVKADFTAASNIQIKFAQTGFYEVNLFNDAALPALPFVWQSTNI